MESKWEKASLGQIADVIDSRHKTPQYTESGMPMVRVVDVKGGSLKLGNTKKVSPADYIDYSKGRDPKVGDLIISRVGSYGNIVYVEETTEQFCLGQNTALIVPKIHWRYLYYQLISPATKTQIEESVVGAVQKTISLKNIKSLEIPIPPLHEQKAIAHVLAALDDKIELNRQMNATLEGMAQALFKSWFVDFDPVLDNALAADNPIPDELEERAETRRQALANGAANREAAKLFPATFHLTEDLGWIPTGWEVSNLKDSTNKIGSGATPRGGSSAYIDEGTRLVRSQNIYDSSFRWPGIVCITDEAAEKLKNVTLTERDVLINITGDSILRTCVVDPAVLPARVNQHVAILRPNVNIPTHYLHQYIVRPEYKTYLRGFDAGGSRSAITKGNLQEAEILIPPDNVLQTFSAIIESFFERKDKNNLEIRSLAKLRDTLLPKLISGELRIPDAEKLAAEALA